MVNRTDELITGLDKILRAMTGITSVSRQSPALHLPEGDLDVAERRHSAGLMRVNHVGEVCAQALYDAQKQFARRNEVRAQLKQAGSEEEDHLAWTGARLRELDSHPSLLNPLWYLGAYALGTIAAVSGDARSLGLVVETERQVEAHLAEHLEKLPLQDAKSRAIVEQMRIDEVAHGDAANAMGAIHPPVLVQKTMKAMAKIMTSTAYYV